MFNTQFSQFKNLVLPNGRLPPGNRGPHLCFFRACTAQFNVLFEISFTMHGKIYSVFSLYIFLHNPV